MPCDPAWERVLSVRGLVFQTINRWCPHRWTEDDKQDAAHDIFLRLHGSAQTWNPDGAAPWPVYARRAAKFAMFDVWKLRRHPVQRLGEYDPVSTRLPSAERCRHCDRALRTKEQMAEGADRRLEVRKHSERLCQACARKRKPSCKALPKRKTRRACSECGKAFWTHQSRRVVCEAKCRERRRRRLKKLRGKASALSCLYCGRVYLAKNGQPGLCSDGCKKGRKNARERRRRHARKHA